jgi:hypothetical protein
MPPPTPLTRRPHATAFSIEDLLDLIRRGEVRVPEFQRPLRWKANDIRDLLDSVYRGYPIGTLLFWKREAPTARIEFGPVRIDSPQTAQALWVVDGQQRITALTGVLLHPPLEGDAAYDDFAFYFDLEKEEFVRLSGREQPLPHWLPMNAVLDSEQLLGWLDRYPGRAEKPNLTRIALKLGKAIREYQVPAYIVETDDPEVLRVIFDRLNSAGKPLSQSEVFHALYGAKSVEHPSDLRGLSASLRELGFGTIEEQWLLKAVLALKGRDITKHFRPQLKGENDLSATLLETERALRAVIVFLKRDAGIVHIDLLPYKLPLALLVRFFHLHPEPTLRSRELLARWVWRGAISELHRGESIRMVRESMAAIGKDEEQSVQNLLALLPIATSQAQNFWSYNFRTAQSKLQVNALVSLQPRDIRSGHLLDVPALLEREGGATIPQLFTSTPHFEESKYAPSYVEPLLWGLANRVFHPPVEKQSFLKVLQTRPPPSPEVLRSHAIPPVAFQELLQGDAVAFLSFRSAFLRRHTEEFLNSRARWQESDRKSLQSLIVADEED